MKVWFCEEHESLRRLSIDYPPRPGAGDRCRWREELDGDWVSWDLIKPCRLVEINSVLRDELGLDEKGHLAYPVTLPARIVGALRREKWLTEARPNADSSLDQEEQ